MGIALMNVYAFALPAQAYYNPSAYGLESAVDGWVWLFSFLFIEDKFRTLFAVLFGAGCLILFETSSTKLWRSHLARMATLFAIGLAHSVVLANNDVLRAYAMAGLFLPFFRFLKSYSLYAIAIGLLTVHFGLGVVAFGLSVLDFHQGAVNSDASLFAERNFGTDPAAIAYSLRLGEEDLTQRIIRRSSTIIPQLSVVASSLPLNLAAMVLGMALWRDRMLSGEWRTFRLQRTAALCCVISLPALFLLAWWVSAANFPGALVGATALVLSAPFDTLLGLAYALAMMAFFKSNQRFIQICAAVGRLSLSNYIATSGIFAALFASWGFGLFASVSRAEAFALSLLPIAAMIIWSPIWLAKFGQGPLERLWRGAARRLS